MAVDSHKHHNEYLTASSGTSDIAITNVSTSVNTDPLARFKDKDKISYFAHNAMEWGVANGITDGVDLNTLGPDMVLTREEVLTILYRFYQKYIATNEDFDPTVLD